MSSTIFFITLLSSTSSNTASDELSQILTEYCNRYIDISDIEIVENPLTRCQKTRYMNSCH